MIDLEMDAAKRALKYAKKAFKMLARSTKTFANLFQR